jgi:hypothetical protein
MRIEGLLSVLVAWVFFRAMRLLALFRDSAGFTLPASNKPSVVPIDPKLHQNKAEEKAA